MNIKKQNTLIEISEMGLKIEVKADLLLNALISDFTKKSLEEMLKNRLEFLIEKFNEIHNLCDSNNSYFESLKEKRNDYVYEYACLSRDLYSIFGDTFELFYEENMNVLDTICSIYKYSDLYGYTSIRTLFLE